MTAPVRSADDLQTVVGVLSAEVDHLDPWNELEQILATLAVVQEQRAALATVEAFLSRLAADKLPYGEPVEVAGYGTFSAYRRKDSQRWDGPGLVKAVAESLCHDENGVMASPEESQMAYVAASRVAECIGVPPSQSWSVTALRKHLPDLDLTEYRSYERGVLTVRVQRPEEIKREGAA